MSSEEISILSQLLHITGGVVILTLLASLLVILVQAIYAHFFSPLAGVPGPFIASFSKLWLVYHCLKGDMHIKMQNLHNQHGKLVRTGPNEVSIADTTAIKQMYGPGSRFRKSNWYSVWQGRNRIDIFAERDIKIHAATRRLVSKIYSMSSITQLEPWVDDALKVFVERIKQEGSNPIDLGEWLQFLAFDVIGEITFSRRFGYIEAGKDDGTLSSIASAVSSLSWVGQIPWVVTLNDLLAPLIGHRLGMRHRSGSIRAFAAREVENRKGRSSEHPDILSQLLDIQREKPNEIDDDGVLSLAAANIFAGSDTTAITLRAVLFYLLTNPQRMEKLMLEIGDFRSQGKLSNPVKFKEAVDMPFLQGCIYEALRLHTAVGLSLPRVVPPGGFSVADYFIPAGTVVGCNPWVIHRNTSAFGPNANEFKPERWMVNDKGDMERAFLAFGGGARLCIGKNISLMEVSKIIPTLLSEFHIEYLKPGKKLDEVCYWFVMQSNFIARLTPKV